MGAGLPDFFAGRELDPAEELHDLMSYDLSYYPNLYFGTFEAIRIPKSGPSFLQGKWGHNESDKNYILITPCDFKKEVLSILITWVIVYKQIRS